MSVTVLLRELAGDGGGRGCFLILWGDARKHLYSLAQFNYCAVIILLTTNLFLGGATQGPGWYDQMD